MAVLRSDEEHVQPATVDAGKACDALLIGTQAEQRDAVQVLGEQTLEPDNVSVRHKVMGGPYRALPHFSQFRVILYVRCTQLHSASSFHTSRR
ncbi:hypothetical protein ALP29_201129 [Pseudomonas syringae pv. avii]|uniref:Uncharacterized protein n=1 Tax=Pseudomonas syringae pv. avii TaxID=663959 RepID=A0A3M5UW31_PSESX|nr:hypothetical protein ALP29_201129 [Pseudomonas syringae pv. avii]